MNTAHRRWLTATTEDLQHVAGADAAGEPLHLIQDKARSLGIGALKPEEQRLLTSRSLDIPAPGNHATDPVAGDDRVVAAQMMLEVSVTDIDPYDRNPRKARHEKYDDIKQAIRAQGLLEVPALTRRPGSTRWMLASGGNTRLQIVQELWAETGDPQFEKYTFAIKPWRGDAHALLYHLSENDSRDDLCFWDKAYAFQDLQEQIALERGVPTLSLREFGAALLEQGLKVSYTMLGNCRFLIRRLGPLSACAVRLSGKAVQILIQPRLNGLGRLLAKGDLDEEGAYTRILYPAMQAYVGSLADPQDFAAEALGQDLVAATATAMGRSAGEVERMLGLLNEAPDLDLDDLTRALAPRSARPVVSTEPLASAGSPTGQAQCNPESERLDAEPQRVSPRPSTPRASPTAEPHPQPIPERAPGAGFAPPAIAADAATLAQAQQIVADIARDFARCYGAEHLYQANADMPAGFFMEFPCAEAVIDDYDTAMAFWWLVQFSRQMCHDKCEAIADPSEWKRTIHESRPGNRPGEWMDIAVARCVFEPEVDTLIRWSFSPRNREIDLFLGLMQACHALYGLDPDRLVAAYERDAAAP